MKRYTTLLLSCLSLLVLAAMPAAGQILWDRTMGTSAYQETSVAWVTVPGGYVSVGLGGSDGTGRQPDQIYLSKVDDAGTVLWQRGLAVPGSKTLYPQAAVADALGHLYVTAIGFNGATLNYSSGLLIKYSPAGDTLWTRVIKPLGGHADFSSIVLAVDGSVVVTGRREPDQFVANYSPTGQELWHRSYDYSPDDHGYLQQLAKLSSGFLVIEAPLSGGKLPRYLLLDENGLLVAEKPAPPFYPYALQPDRTGNLLAAAGRLTKISPEGDSLWTRSYRLYGSAFEVMFAAQAVPGGNYLLCGTRYNGIDRDLGLVVVDQNGTTLRDTLFVLPGTDEYPSGATFDSQGNYIVAGYTTEGPVGRADQFAFKLRNWNRTLPTRAASASLTAYSLYPNPAPLNNVRVATSSGTAFLGEYQICDTTGKLVRLGRTTPSGIPLDDLPPGLYLIQLRQGEHWLPAQRLARQ
jgi:hypothetical protein